MQPFTHSKSTSITGFTEVGVHPERERGHQDGIHACNPSKRCPFHRHKEGKKDMVEQGIRLTIVITTDYSVICSDYSSEDKKMQKYVEQIDKRTGEVMDGCMVWIPHRPKLTERWFMAFQDSFIELAKDQELTLEHKNILLYLFGRLDFENFIQQSQSEIAESLGMQKQKCIKSNENAYTKTNCPGRAKSG